VALAKLRERFWRWYDRFGRSYIPVAHYDVAEMAEVLASLEPILIFAQTAYEGERLATAVVTPTALIVNSAMQPKDVNHTELALRVPVSAMGAVSLRKANVVYRLMNQFTSDYLVVATRDGRTRSFYFREKEKALPCTLSSPRSWWDAPPKDAA
jgi:hypothetical protein